LLSHIVTALGEKIKDSACHVFTAISTYVAIVAVSCRIGEAKVTVLVYLRLLHACKPFGVAVAGVIISFLVGTTLIWRARVNAVGIRNTSAVGCCCSTGY